MSSKNICDEQVAELCKALAHPARIQILKKLIDEDRCICGQIVQLLPLAQSTVSQHLKILKEAGLVQGETEGQTTCYCIDKKMLANLGSAINNLLRLSSPGGNVSCKK